MFLSIFLSMTIVETNVERILLFKVSEAAKPLRGRSPGPKPKRSEAWTQVNDRAKEKKSFAGWGEGGHTIIVLNGMY